MAAAAQQRWPAARARRRNNARSRLLSWRVVVCVLLPFAAGFHLSYLLRTINALIAGPLSAELGIGAGELGLLTSAYFLAFGAAQIPCGILLDRHGPKLVLGTLLLIASAGALVFALADNLALLTLGRALIGLGVAAALMAGLKAIVLWVPADRSAGTTGWMMMLGTLGAMTATVPAGVLLDSIGWRGLFAVMAGMLAACALLVLLLAPDADATTPPAGPTPGITVRTIFLDARFWRIAPLSALGIGISWALHGLWAAPWLRDVDGFEHTTVVGHLGIMAMVLSLSGLALGTAADRLRTMGVRTDTVLAATFAVSLAAQIALVLGWPLPPVVPWSGIAIAGVATVLGYTVLGEIFPKHASGRANGALNLLQVGAAFVVQSLFGCIVALWAPEAGRYPAEAYRTALVFFITLQLLALGWFAVARKHAWPGAAVQCESTAFRSRIDYRRAARLWIDEQASTQRDAAAWRRTAIAMLTILGAVGATSLSEPQPDGSLQERLPPAIAAAASHVKAGWQLDNHNNSGRARGR